MELFRRAKNEETALALLEGRTDFVPIAQDAGRNRVLDVARAVCHSHSITFHL